ncbi:UspA domain protein [Verrucomicrobia bacterium]|nr:UspA domain protein [Verrucomicrobiota bacterium]
MNGTGRQMKILICSDGSPQADRAVRLGVTIASGCQAETTLLGVIESPGQAKALLDSLEPAQRLLGEKTLPAELITKPGDPIEQIIRRTEEYGYDLVVIGAVLKVPRGRFWMSSKSYKIIKAIKPPVLLVAGPSTTVKRILICSGGKRYIDNAVKLAGQISRGLGAQVTLLHVMPEPPALYSQLPCIDETVAGLLESHSELGLNLRRAKESLEVQGVAVQVHLRRGSILAQILSEIADGNYELVVTGSALSGSLRTYMLGDISREIVNRANRAILVVRGVAPPPDVRSHLSGLLRSVIRSP